ncbi:MAG: tetratricopeptide (TPR) repeat protein [Paracoccaceae bacterium]|jgi:tetratricopeptide (TPR) repeat protein
MLRSLLCLFFLTALSAQAQNYDVQRPPGVIATDQIQRITIITQAEMELGDLPDHPKITWLGYSSVRLRNLRLPDGTEQMQTDNRIEFIATAPGVIEFPPIPIVLENKEFFIRIGDLRVLENQASESDTRLEVYWNGQLEIPKQVHLGEAVEIKFVEMIVQRRENYSAGAFFSTPSNRVTGGQWHAFTHAGQRKPYPSDYFLSSQSELFNRDPRYRMSMFRRDPYSSRDTYDESTDEIEGADYYVRTYQARLYFTKLGKATGHLSATLGTSSALSRKRTHVLPFEIEVLPIPALPNDQAIDTGLVGDWQFEPQIRPRKPMAAKPLDIEIAITGQGNPDLRNQLDLSADGFPSVGTKFQPRVGYNYDFWEGDFVQTLLPTGKVGTLPAITLASFDTVGDQWRYHEITPAITLPGFTDVTAAFSPRAKAGPSITRPVLLNLPAATFGAFALAPLLPFLFGFAKRRLDTRDPEAKKRERILKKLIQDFQSGNGTPEALDSDLLPILRTRLDLPAGATVREIAEVLDNPELSASLLTHAESSFSTTAAPVDFKALATQLAKLSLLLMLTFASLRGATLDEANTFYAETNYSQAIATYNALIKEDPNRASLYFNLAQTHFAAGEPARARAACHTALLLDPLDQESRNLMTQIRERLGDLTVARNRFLDLRPDQWIIIAATIWVISFLYFAIRKFQILPRWPGFVLTSLALLLLGTAAWRQTHNYASEQYMVIAEELPREPTAGTPDWDYPALRAGQIVRIAEINTTHARVESSDSSFWLPVKELQQVW